MRKDLDEKLCSTYPEIFKDRHTNMRQTAMCWGFSCGDGWYPVIDFLCSTIMNRVQNARNRVKLLRETLSENQTDWNEWKKKAYNPEKLEEAERELAEAEAGIPVAVQVKEKFGGLRFYVNGGDESTHEMINLVEALSYRVCEECGTMKDVVTYTMGWHTTLCPEHAKEKYGDEAEAFRNKTGQWADEGEF